MNIKKFLLSFSLVFVVFFVGNMSADAATYKYCNYAMAKGFTYNNKGKTTDFDSYLSIVYKDNKLVAFSNEKLSYVNYVNQVLDKYSVFGTNSKKMKDVFVDGNCPDKIESKRAFRSKELDYDLVTSEANAGSLEADWPFVFERIEEKTYNDLSALNCSYKLSSLGNDDEHIPFFMSDSKQRINNDIDITFSPDNLFSPSASVDTSGGKPTNKTPELKNKFLEALSGDYIKENDDTVGKGSSIDHPAIAYKYLLDSLKNKQCPTYMIYHQSHGYYVADWEISLGGAPDLVGVGKNKGDKGYTIYKSDNTKYCASVINQYETMFTNLTNVLERMDLELQAFITNRNLTQEQYQSYQNTLDEINQGLEQKTGKYGLLGNLNTDFSGENSCANTDYLSTATAKKEEISNRISLTGEIRKVLIQAIEASEVISTEQKEESKEALEKTLQSISKNFSQITLGDGYNQDQTCEGIFDFDNPNSVGYMLQQLFTMIKIIAPILVILFGALDFGKAVISSDQDALKKAQSSFIKRCIAAVALFFLPTLINLILEKIDVISCNLK